MDQSTPERESCGFGAVCPVLATRNVMETARWYRDVLGFQIDNQWSSDDWAMLWADDSQLFLRLDPEVAAKAEGQQVLIAAPDVDAVYERHKAKRANIVSPLENKPWGPREYTVKDPSRYHLRFQKWIG
ncbi:MAG: VOC family protein [Planctomycetales bacterium]